ncbi:MAG: hypothetical protein RIQ59_996 [Bacteroidota bacterium]
MKLLFITLLFMILVSCSQNNKIASKAEKTKFENGQKAENDLSVTDSAIKSDSIFFASKREKNRDFKLDFALVSNTDLTLDSTNSIIINKSTVLSIMPHSKIIEKYQRNLGEDGWNTVLDDNLYYESIFIDSLKKRKIPHTYFFRDKRYLVFKKNNGTKIILDQKKFLNAWGYILFNGKDIPTFWNELEITHILTKIYN